MLGGIREHGMKEGIKVMNTLYLVNILEIPLVVASPST